MNWTTVSSSWVLAIAYEDTTQELYVRFRPATTCVYAGISQAQAQSFMTAPSKGKWVHRNLYGRGYRIV